MHVINALIYDLSKIIIILKEYFILNIFDGMDIYYTRLYVNNHCVTYLKSVIDKHGFSEYVNK